MKELEVPKLYLPLLLLFLADSSRAQSCLEVFSPTPSLEHSVFNAMEIMKTDLALLSIHQSSGFENLDQSQVWQFQMNRSFLVSLNRRLQTGALPFPIELRYDNLYSKYKNAFGSISFFEKATSLGFKLQPPTEDRARKMIQSSDYKIELIHAHTTLAALKAHLQSIRSLEEKSVFPGYGLFLSHSKIQQTRQKVATALDSFNRLARLSLLQFEPNIYNYDGIFSLMNHLEEILIHSQRTSFGYSFSHFIFGEEPSSIQEANKQIEEFYRLKKVLKLKESDSLPVENTL